MKNSQRYEGERVGMVNLYSLKLGKGKEDIIRR